MPTITSREAIEATGIRICKCDLECSFLGHAFFARHREAVNEELRFDTDRFDL